MIENCKTLVELLRARAVHNADRLAFSFLEDGDTEGERLTFAELDKRARRIAGWLQASHTQKERALLLFPAGLDFIEAFFGCLYAGLIPIPAPAPEASRRKRTVPRLKAIVSDADVTVVLSTADILNLIKEVSRNVPEIEALRLFDVEEIPVAAEGLWLAPDIAPNDLAYLQYTSGSTTSPKGVMISHHNVLHHCRDIRTSCEYGPDSASITWLPYFHDYGLVEGLLVPLLNGTPAYVMSPFAFLKRPLAWLRAISRLRVTHTQGPSFAYDQCVRRIKPEQLVQLDLRSLHSIENAAEPINPWVLEDFYRMFAPCGLRREAICPAYGLAEATLMVSCCPGSLPPRIVFFRTDALGEGKAVATADAAAASSRRIVSCGRPIGKIRVAVVDPMTCHEVADGRVGEIWVSDPCIALGYWQRKRDSEETFRACIAGSGEGPFLRTGDLGFMSDGELYVTSRMKDLIIVAGTNHYPQDIEWTVEQCHPAIRSSHVAASSVYASAEERVLIAAEVERGTIETVEAVQDVLNAVRRAIAEEHELQVYAVVILNRGSLPKTASGKIQRHACERLLRGDGDEVIARWIVEKGLDRVRFRETANG